MNLELALPEEVGPTERSYWVVTGRLAAGGYPDPNPCNDKIGQLLDAGVNLFVNLTQDYSGGTDAHMNRYDIRAGDHHAVMVRREIPDLGITSRAEMVTTLDVIDRHLAHGCNVYVHCWGGIGRTGTVVGCWLRRHGYAGPGEVIDLLQDLRRMGNRRSGHVPSPQTGAQRRMVKNWRTGA